MVGGQTEGTIKHWILFQVRHRLTSFRSIQVHILSLSASVFESFNWAIKMTRSRGARSDKSVWRERKRTREAWSTSSSFSSQSISILAGNPSLDPNPNYFTYTWNAFKESPTDAHQDDNQMRFKERDHGTGDLWRSWGLLLFVEGLEPSSLFTKFYTRQLHL